MKERICPECGGIVTGRSDKIYCCDSCRVNHHNKQARAQARAARKAVGGKFSIVRLKEFFLAMNKNLF